MRLGGMELLLLFAVLLLLFGASRLPQLGSSIGQAIRNFKKGFNEGGEPEADDAAKKVVAISEGKETAQAAPAAKVKENR